MQLQDFSKVALCECINNQDYDFFPLTIKPCNLMTFFQHTQHAFCVKKKKLTMNAENNFLEVSVSTFICRFNKRFSFCKHLSKRVLKMSSIGGWRKLLYIMLYCSVHFWLRGSFDSIMTQSVY